MNFPFTQEQFFSVFQSYNTSIWPSQILLYILAFLILYLIHTSGKDSHKIVSGILGGFWLWMGVVYHWGFFSSINPAAKLFGFLFVLQAIFFLYEGLIKENLTFSYSNSLTTKLGIILIFFGTIIYPILGYFSGHIYPNSPTFGLPCPTTIYTLGVLFFVKKLPIYLMIIPILWSAIGFMAAKAFGVTEDIFLLIAGIISLSNTFKEIYWRRRGFL